MILRKCKTLSRQLGRSSSYSSLRSKSSRDELWGGGDHMQDHDHEHHETIFVGSTRKRYVISSKYLSHPLINALIDKTNKQKAGEENSNILVVKCEVVLFDHLLWMLENADPNLSSESLEELAELYLSWWGPCNYSLYLKVRSGQKEKSLMDIHVRLWLHLRTCNGSNFLSSMVQLYVILIIDLCPNSIFGIDGPTAWWMNIMKWVIHHCINGFFFLGLLIGIVLMVFVLVLFHYILYPYF